MLKPLLLQLIKVGYRVPHGDYILKDVDIVVHKGDKVALIGPNGSGKSTILKMIMNDLEPTKGRVEKYGKVVYLPQVHFDLSKDIELYEFISQIAENWWEVLKYAQDNFNFPDISPNRKIGTLSGGELMKVYVSKFLMAEPDILLLDEPTNHIDVSSMESLVNILKGFKGSIIAATHDTFFINQFANRVLEIDNKEVIAYGGNYDLYLNVRMQHDDAHARKVFAVRTKMNRLGRAIRIEQNRYARNVQAATPRNDRSMSRMERGFFKEQAQKSTSRIQNNLFTRKDRIKEKLEAMERPKRKEVEFRFADRAGDITMLFQIKEGILRVEENVLIKDFEFQVNKGERVAILGNNGSGKTLFLKSILEIQDKSVVLEGEMIRNEAISEYIGQGFEKIVKLSREEDSDVLSTMEADPTQIYKNLVGQLGLSAVDIHRDIETFSGGELTKLSLLDLSHKPLDLLVLDEPTNHLDILSQDALIEALEDFKGALLVTSHKIDFLANLGLSRAFVIKNQKLVEITGDLSDPQVLFKAVVG
jgi:ATPase subunit of ABC transporter with duplicated ATPase domains